MMKICCYGDSNTWGYDPRSPFGEQLPAPWPAQLAEKAGWECENWGSCGRCIPHLPQSFSLLRKAILERKPDCFIILLGTNDVLTMEPPRADKISYHMESLVCYLRKQFPELSIVLLSPPRIRIPGEALQKAASALAPFYESIARRYQLSYLDLQPLSLPLACDGVHLSQKGHDLLAQALAERLFK